MTLVTALPLFFIFVVWPLLVNIPSPGVGSFTLMWLASLLGTVLASLILSITGVAHTDFTLSGILLDSLMISVAPPLGWLAGSRLRDWRK